VNVFDQFTDRARMVMGLARQEAERLQHAYIGTEHLLLGLVEEGSGIAASVLKNLDVDPQSARAEVEKLVRRGETATPSGQVPFTPRAKRVLELGVEEAATLGHAYVGTEHLLLGLIREDEGVGAQVLRTLGAGIDRVRSEVMVLIGGEAEGGAAESRPATAAPGARHAQEPMSRKIEVLERRMAEALAREDFERAAKIRDELAALRARPAQPEPGGGATADVLRDAVRVARGASGVLQGAAKELAAAEQALRRAGREASEGADRDVDALLEALRRHPESFARILRELGVSEAAFAAVLSAERARLRDGKRDPA
jgi:ATP-dependent Clp protease ATP-binding subunit ClpA